MTIEVERVLRNVNDKQCGVTAIVDGNRVPKMRLIELCSLLRQGYKASNFVVSGGVVRAKKGNLPVGYLLTQEEMQRRFPDKWLVVKDGVYFVGSNYVSSTLGTCESGVVVAVYDTADYLRHRDEYENGVYSFERTFPERGVHLCT